ncbi:MAG: ComF family protein [Bradymonadia bacterium]|jgi:ComF family protein
MGTWRLRHENAVEETVAFVVSDWESPTKDAVRALKFNREGWRGAPLGDELARHAAHRLGELRGILPVPVHRVRLRERGFNQCDRLARGVSRRLKVPIFNVLHRCDQQRQSELTSEARAEVQFRCDPIPPGRYVIVDDLITTGHTLRACAHAAEDSGATEVIGLALCRAARRSD